MEEVHIVMGYPAREPDRERLRQFAKEKHIDVAIPVSYTGSVEQACPVCGLICAIGPRQQEKLKEPGIILRCVWCCLEEIKGCSVEVRDLGNPESRPESNWD